MTTLNNSEKLPNFFILGAPKCGTTSMVAWLSEHPNIYMSPTKEPRFFDTDLKTRFRISPQAYAKLFDGATEQHKIRAEATVWYLYSKDAVPNIERELPGSKYLILIRNPVDMAYSLHEQMTLHQVEHIADFKKAWQMSPHRRQGRKTSLWISESRLLDYQSVCLLGTQLERLFSLVPRERILVLVLDDIKKDPRHEYLKVLQFLDVPDDQRDDFSPRNPAKRVRYHTLQRLIVLGIKSERVLKSKLGLPPTNSKLFPLLNQWNKVPRPRPPLPVDFKTELQQYFKPEVAKLQRLLQRDFSSWIDTKA